MQQERYIEQEEYLNIRELLHIIKKRLALVLTLPIIFSAMAAIYSFFILKPVYQAGISIIISKKEGSVLTASDVNLYQSLTKTYTQIAKSAVVAERAIRDGKLETTAGALQSSLIVGSQEGSQVLYMSVVSGQPEDAVNKVEAIAKAFIQESQRLLRSENVEIMDHAKVPQGPINSKRLLYVVVAFAMGLLTSIGFALIIESMNDSIKSEEDVERYFGIPILGVIPKHM